MSKLLSVQILRALAALAIAMHHAQYDAAGLAQRLGLGFRAIEAPWSAGVDVFFVISGFIMVHASRGLFGEPGASRVFLARRVARIAPLYWAATSLYLAVALAAPALLNSEGLSPGLVLASYVFLPWARPDGAVQPAYSLGWTLNYEMFFYALFALALTRPWRQGVPALIAMLLALVAFGRLLGSAAPWRFWTDPIILEFAFGMALGVARLKGARLGPIVRAVLAGGGLVLFALDLARPEGALASLRVLAYGVPATMLVAAAALAPDEGRASSLARFGAWLGDASYALYLVHPFVIRGAREIVWDSDLAGVIGPWGFVVASLGATILAALLVHRWFERPTTDRVRRWLEPAMPRGTGEPARTR